MSIGILVILIGFALVIVGSILTLLKSKQTKTEGGFVFFIGPFPIVGATSREMFYALLVVSIVIFVISIILSKRLIF